MARSETANVGRVAIRFGQVRIRALKELGSETGTQLESYSSIGAWYWAEIFAWIMGGTVS